MRIVRRKIPAPYIPFISLADIAWQIIIFFLIASTFVKNFSLNVPMPTASPVRDVPPARSINLRAGETVLTVNGANVALPELESYLSSLLSGAEKEEDRAVVVYPADDLSFQRNADILYAIQKAGGIVIISEEKGDEDSPPAP